MTLKLNCSLEPAGIGLGFADAVAPVIRTDPRSDTRAMQRRFRICDWRMVVTPSRGWIPPADAEAMCLILLWSEMTLAADWPRSTKPRSPAPRDWRWRNAGPMPCLSLQGAAGAV